MTEELPERLKKELAPGERGVSSIPNTRPRFGWQDDDRVGYQDAAGNRVDFETWLELGPDKVAPPAKRLRRNPFAD